MKIIVRINENDIDEYVKNFRMPYKFDSYY